MSKVVWTRQAVRDLDAIRAYIARDSERYARLVAESLAHAVERLEVFPFSGRVVPEFHDESIREVLWGNYRIVYRVSEGLVEVATVFHGSRRLDPFPGK